MFVNANAEAAVMQPRVILPPKSKSPKVVFWKPGSSRAEAGWGEAGDDEPSSGTSLAPRPIVPNVRLK